jgi:uncharacterized lipoprotein YmbA
MLAVVKVQARRWRTDRLIAHNDQTSCRTGAHPARRTATLDQQPCHPDLKGSSNENLARLTCVVATSLGACASPLPPSHVTLDDGRPRVVRSSMAPSVAVLRVNVPDLIDRPQLVLRTDGNQVKLSEQYRWAEPLRREIPRVIATDLGELLDSSGVVAPPADVESFAPEFKLMLDIQQLDAVVGQGVDIDGSGVSNIEAGGSSLATAVFGSPW